MFLLVRCFYRGLTSLLLVLAMGRLVIAAADGQPLSGAAPARVDFVRDIEPVLRMHCHECHGPDNQEGGLRLTSRAAALAGGDSGEKAIVPGKPAESRLIRLVSGEDPNLFMPPKDEGEPLSAEEISLLVRWINEGADWPDEAQLADRRLQHWAWKPPVRPVLPVDLADAWSRNAIDRLVLARLRQEGLSPAAGADRHMLVRRVYLDLIGLPPPLDVVEEFVNDPRPDAYDRLVDRLLADPGYGERWARMWLDLARYADSKGYGSDPLRTIWRYRDWVIEAFNRNLPYDEFTLEQLAGDLLPNASPDQVLATAFHRNTMANDEGGTDDEEFRVAAVKDRIETTMQVWMGLTAGCAKCHSHKFDPLTQREYYQLYAFFNQTADADRGDEEPRLSTPTRDQHVRKAELEQRLAEVRRQRSAPSEELDRAQAEWEQAVQGTNGAWRLLMPSQAVSAGGATLEIQPDGAVLAQGSSPETDTYTIDVGSPSDGIQAIRLEVLSDERLPGGGPGRQPESGGFVLSELKLSARPSGPQAITGRYVRIELPGTQRLLSLAEVQVLNGEQNLALAGKATQSSTDYDGPPELAIDGITNGHYFEAHSTTHTKSEDNPWWEVDLGATVQLDRLVVWNRTDNELQKRLDGFQATVLDENRQAVWQTSVPMGPKPSAELKPGDLSEIALASAVSDISIPAFPIAGAIDGNAASESGWSAGAADGQPHAAMFILSGPLESSEGATLSFSLAQAAGKQQTIGRLRLWATSAALPASVMAGGAVPDRIAQLLSKAASDHTAQDQAEVTGYYRSIAPGLAAARDELRSLEAGIKALAAELPTTPILRELEPAQRRVTHLMVKGNFLSPGDAVEAAVPEAFHPLPEGAAYDRLGLAQWLVAPENPLTARVAVNRYWAQLFGLGIVETQEDFGTQGLAPSHPELLDLLAGEFVVSGWNSKHLLRLIVSSATYRQTSTAPRELVIRDPSNRLLARGPRGRLEAEIVRDQALSFAGLLSRKSGGPSVYPPQPDGLWRAAFNGERTWPTSTGEDRYRRGLYTFWRRTVPYPSMAAFDAPSREICTLRRSSTNTPLQAFVTLNDPVYVEASQALARRIVREGGESVESWAMFGLRLVLARPPHPGEVAQLVGLHGSELAHYQADQAAAVRLATEPIGPLPEGADAAEMAAWTVVSNVLLNLDGVLTRR